MPRYDTVLFDLDGTLIDSIRLILDSYHHTLAAFGLPTQTDQHWLSGIGTPLRVQLEPFVSSRTPLDALVAVYREYNVDNHDRLVRPYPGASEAVRALAAAGVRLAVVTSKNRPGTERGLRAAGLDGTIEVLVCAEDVEHPKPHRDPVDRALALLGAGRSGALFVGDSVHDMHAGRAAEVGTGAALWGPFARADLQASRPTHWLGAPDDVVRLVLG